MSWHQFCAPACLSPDTTNTSDACVSVRCSYIQSPRIWGWGGARLRLSQALLPVAKQCLAIKAGVAVCMYVCVHAEPHSCAGIPPKEAKVRWLLSDRWGRCGCEVLCWRPDEGLIVPHHLEQSGLPKGKASAGLPASAASEWTARNLWHVLVEQHRKVVFLLSRLCGEGFVLTDSSPHWKGKATACSLGVTWVSEPGISGVQLWEKHEPALADTQIHEVGEA